MPKRLYVSSFDRHLKIVSEYDQEIPQSQTADNPVARYSLLALWETVIVLCLVVLYFMSLLVLQSS